MDNDANREVSLLTRDLDTAIAMGNRLWVVFYLGVGVAISHALFGFPRFSVSVDYLILGIASVMFISIAWAVLRSVLRQRKAVTCQEDNRGNKFLE